MRLDTIKLFSAVHFLRQPGQVTDVQNVKALNAEIASYGYTLSPRLIDALVHLSTNTFMTYRTALLANLAELSGAGAVHTRLFNNFPYDTPDQWEYLTNRVIGYVKSVLDLVDDPVMLSCGHAIDTRQFNLDDFGVCPICQRGVDELSSTDGEKYPYQRVTPLKVIDFMTLDDLCERLEALLARKSSLSADEKRFLARPEWRLMLSLPEELYRENVPFAFEITGRDIDRIMPHLSSLTDIMRIAYFLSNPESDLSLKENVRFTLTTSERKTLLKLINGYVGSRPMIISLETIAADMLRDRERWLRLGETINPGTAKNRVRFPHAYGVFDILRNKQEAIPSFNRTIEKAVRSSNITPATLASLKTRPGVFARRLDSVLRRCDEKGKALTIAAFNDVIDAVPTPTLLALMKFFMSRNRQTDRVYFIKGARNAVHYDEKPRPPLDESTARLVTVRIQQALYNRFKPKDDTPESIFIDPVLNDIVIPFNRRGDSSTITPIIKGSRYPFSGDVVRMFIHWTGGSVDVDLSATLMGDDFNVIQTIAFTDLHGWGCTHSGDVQSAPNGASEFIDVSVQKLLDRGVRYVSMSVNVYRGGTFKNFPCFAGYMERDSLTSGAVYQPETVKLKFDVTMDTTSANPLVFDLKERKVVFADMSSGRRSYGVVAAQKAKQIALAKASVTIPERKPTFGDLAEILALARGPVLVRTRDQADTVWDESSMATLLETAGIS